jgi:hypothetical protein
MREIIDIRSSSEFSISFPWLESRNYLECNEPYGVVEVRVLNPLRCPETASTTVEMMMYVAFNDDFELSNPSKQAWHQIFSPQSGILPEKKIARGFIGDTQVKGKSMAAASMSAGEVFTSVKQLLMRVTPWKFVSSVTGTTFSVYPWQSGYTWLADTTGVYSNSGLGGDLYSKISQMYAFQKEVLMFSLLVPRV